jgi:hypothetical protein
MREETKTVDRTATAFTFQGYHAKQTNDDERKSKNKKTTMTKRLARPL